MLTSFGIFWSGEGAKAEWPGGTIALIALVVAVALGARGLVRLLATRRQAVLAGRVARAEASR
jgi:uncharacterized membrane protein